MFLFFLQHTNCGLKLHLLVSYCSLFLSQKPAGFFISGDSGDWFHSSFLFPINTVNNCVH